MRFTHPIAALELQLTDQLAVDLATSDAELTDDTASAAESESANVDDRAQVSA